MRLPLGLCRIWDGQVKTEPFVLIWISGSPDRKVEMLSLFIEIMLGQLFKKIYGSIDICTKLLYILLAFRLHDQTGMQLDSNTRRTFVVQH